MWHFTCYSSLLHLSRKYWICLREINNFKFAIWYVFLFSRRKLPIIGSTLSGLCFSPSLEAFKARLDWPWAAQEVSALPMARGWSSVIFKVSSNPCHSMILFLSFSKHVSASEFLEVVGCGQCPAPEGAVGTQTCSLSVCRHCEDGIRSISHMLPAP